MILRVLVSGAGMAAHSSMRIIMRIIARRKATTGGPRVQGEPRNPAILQSPVTVTRRGGAMQCGRDRKARVTGGSPCLC
jgi:hypothetical protein